MRVATSPREFEQALAEPGDVVVYHVGLLMADRQRLDRDGARAKEMGAYALHAAMRGRVFLTQKRQDDAIYEYRATLSSRA